MRVRPIELRDANDFVATQHRHHKPVVGHRFSLAAFDGDRLCGVCVIGRPVSRHYNPLRVVEVTRLCTDGTHNACSILYGAAARAAKAMGYDRIQTYTLPEEGGASLRATGWTCEGEQESRPWVYYEPQQTLPGFPNRRRDQPMGNKVRWSRSLDAKGDSPQQGGPA
jgi:hypothetical protein